MSTASSYAEHLNAQAEAVEAFVGVLHRERSVLADIPVPHEALAEVTRAKAEAAERLETLERERRTLTSLPAGSAASEEAHFAASMDCSALWDALVRDLAAARHQNALNGLAVQSRLQATEARLSILRPQPAGGLYNASGQRHDGRITGRLRGGA